MNEPTDMRVTIGEKYGIGKDSLTVYRFGPTNSAGHPGDYIQIGTLERKLSKDRMYFVFEENVVETQKVSTEELRWITGVAHGLDVAYDYFQEKIADVPHRMSEISATLKDLLRG
jgi:hypothetical protein